MLRLASQTDAAWGAWAVAHLDEILLDHAHCEKKAASTALSLIFRYPDRPSLVQPLSALAREELEHFELVLGHVRRRGGEFARQVPSPYAPRLMEIVRREEPWRLLDTLLCCAMIEARSCERMQRFAVTLRQHEHHDLVELYDGLLACEARHHQAYVDLALGCEAFEPEVVWHRLREIAAHEASVVSAAPEDPRLHNGCPAHTQRRTDAR